MNEGHGSMRRRKQGCLPTIDEQAALSPSRTRHIIPALGHIQLQRLTAQHIQGFYASELANGLAAKTVRGYHALLHSALKNAVKWNLVARNACDLVSSPVPQNHEMQPLTPEQAQRLLQVAHNHRLHALLTVAIATGMRKGELFGLHWQDIDFDAGCLYVGRSVILNCVP